MRRKKTHPFSPLPSGFSMPVPEGIFRAFNLASKKLVDIWSTRGLAETGSFSGAIGTRVRETGLFPVCRKEGEPKKQ